jgi:hypothetical protein
MGGVGGSADDAAVAAAEGLEVGGGVDVGHRGDGLIRVQHLGQLLPGPFHVGQVGHVGHGATGGEVGQDGDLFGAGEDVRHLGHEMDAAEDDVLGLGPGGLARQLEGIAGVVGMPEHLFTLVVVAKDHQALTQGRLGGADAGVQLLVAQADEILYFDCMCRHAVYLGLLLPGGFVTQ